MKVKEFILQVANGTLYKDDILSFVSNSWDKENLLWDLYLADKVVNDETGLPLISTEVEINRIANAIEQVSTHFNVSLIPQHPNEKSPGCNCDDIIVRQIPEELQTEKAQNLLGKLIEKGFCDNNYNWNKELQLLAYFAKRASLYLELSNKTKENRQTRCMEKQTSWKPFEALFTYKNKKLKRGKLHDAEQNCLRYNPSFSPTGYECIDDLFE